MLPMLWKFMTTTAFFYTFFFILHVATAKSERISNNIESTKVYVSSWAVQLQNSAIDDDARFIARSQGLKYEKVPKNALANTFSLFDFGKLASKRLTTVPINSQIFGIVY